MTVSLGCDDGSAMPLFFCAMPTTTLSHRLSQKRLSRVPRFLGVCGMAWASYAFYFMATGRMWSMWLCVLEATIAFSLIPLTDRVVASRKWVAHFNLLVAAFGVVLEGISSGGFTSATPVFLACLPVVAAHQLGLRSALAWTFVAMLGMVLSLYGFDFHLLSLHRLPTQLDHVVMFSGVGMLLFMMARIAERSYEMQVIRLIGLADGLKEQTRLLALAEQTAGVGHWHLDLSEQLFELSDEAMTLCGVAASSSPHVTFDEFTRLFTDESREAFARELEASRHSPHEFSIGIDCRSNASSTHLVCRGFSETLNDHDVRGIFGVIKDESETHRIQQRLLSLATLDPLTQLPNRHSFQMYLESVIKEADENASRVALMIIDMDGFKSVNDTMGHPVGDKILQAVAIRLQESVGKKSYVARLGGDEFVVVCRDFRTLLDVTIRGGQIARHVGKPYTYHGKLMHLSASIGAAVYPDDTNDPVELLSFADTAMYRTKQSRSAVAMYDASMTADTARRTRLENRLRDALAADEFFLSYQPQVTMAHQQIVMFEALARWNCDGHITPPKDFIPVLESTGGIIEVGRWILRQACRQTREWNDAGFDVGISVNISPLQFRDPDFVPHVWTELDTSGLPAEKLSLEINESILSEDLEDVISKLELLEATGVNISIDDFGSGYSSLAFLRRMPINRLKIDSSFIRDYPDRDDGRIVRTMIRMANSLRLTTVAEGVETIEQLNFLREQGCDEYQGFLFSKPLSADEAESLLSDLKVSTNGGSHLESLIIPSTDSGFSQSTAQTAPPVERSS